MEKEHYLSVGSRRRPSGERSAFSFLPPQTPTLNNTESCLLFDPGRRWKRGGTKRKGSRGGGKQDVSDGGEKVLSKKGCGGKESVGGAFVRWRLTGNSAPESEGKEEEEEEGEEVRRGEKSGKKRNGNLFAHTPFSSSLHKRRPPPHKLTDAGRKPRCSGNTNGRANALNSSFLSSFFLPPCAPKGEIFASLECRLPTTGN